MSDIQSINLGRIVPAPMGGADTDPVYYPPRLYVLSAGATGLAANQADSQAQVALARDLQSNTGSPNPTSPVGSAGSAGTLGARVAADLQPTQLRRAITGPGGQTVSTTVGRVPKWAKPALYIAVGLGVGWLVFK
jgi:hypothetical protein